MGPRAGLDGCEKSRPHRDSIPAPSWPTLVIVLVRIYVLLGVVLKITVFRDATVVDMYGRVRGYIRLS